MRSSPRILLIAALVLAMVGVFAQPAAVSAQTAHPYDCSQLDYGLYWYGKNSFNQKAVAGVANPYYSPTKPTVIYVHGWQQGSIAVGGRENFWWPAGNINTAHAWIDAGWNIGIFHWTQFADEPGGGVGNAIPYYAEAKIWSGTYVDTAPDPDVAVNMRWRTCNGAFSTAGMPNVSAAQLFYNAYTSALSGYSGPEIRLVGHSLGNQLVVRTARMVSDNIDAGRINSRLLPTRVALVDPYWSNGAKTYLGNRWVGELIREHVTHLRNNRNMAFEWSKTSNVLDLGGDQNDALINLISRTEIVPTFIANTDQAGRHNAAPKLYFQSFASPAPAECWSNSPSGSCSATGRRAHSASTGLARTREIMNAGGKWYQHIGLNTATAADNQYRCIDRCP